MANASDLKSDGVILTGSSPVVRTIQNRIAYLNYIIESLQVNKDKLEKLKNV